MCSIVGIQGNFKADDLIAMLKTSKNRGIDASGIALDNKVYKNIDLNDFDDDNFYSLGLGHNLLAVHSSKDRTSQVQPLAKNNLVLVFNGEIYNYSSLKNLLAKLTKNEGITSDSELLINLIDFYYDGDLLHSVKKVINLLDGDYAFAVSDNINLAIARDPLGVKPLFYTDDAFASSKQCLKGEIRTLKPGHILYNWEDVYPQRDIFQKRIPTDNRNLEKLVKLAVSKRVEDLDEVGVIFSGGVDSSLIALLLREISLNKNLKITLYAVGGKNSKDVVAAKCVANYLGLPLKVHDVNENIVKDNLKPVVRAIGENNLMKIGVGMTVYLASKMVAEDNIKVAISGQGADELFGGYNRYLKSYNENTLDDELRHDLANMYHVNLERDDACSMANGVELRLPFLDKKLVEFALNIPIKYKVSGSEDKLRKNILRKLAFNLGLNKDIAYRPKKAAQYGTGIDKILRKKVLKDVDIEDYLKK
ncbi:asparagine synthetase B [uncultured Methanobrevibacter sp.]|uniref:asparagine synthetase B n=1 Tax=uncultured Methanobrevibacter sp. TaxID=253161 RepID=UPI00262FD003|nr:asparagine synthetase B [uncultured Methanobrevibacter sp.]